MAPQLCLLICRLARWRRQAAIGALIIVLSLRTTGRVLEEHIQVGGPLSCLHLSRRVISVDVPLGEVWSTLRCSIGI